MDEKVLKYRKRHKRCKYCKYLKRNSPREKIFPPFMCAAKDKFIGGRTIDKLRFCSCYEVNENIKDYENYK